MSKYGHRTYYSHVVAVVHGVNSGGGWIVSSPDPILTERCTQAGHGLVAGETVNPRGFPLF